MFHVAWFFYSVLKPICVTLVLPVDEAHCIDRCNRLIGSKHTIQVGHLCHTKHGSGILSVKQIHVLLTEVL